MDHQLTSNRFRSDAYISDESALSAPPPPTPFVDLGMPPAELRGLMHPLETIGLFGNSASTEVLATTNNPSVDAAAKLRLRAKEADPWCVPSCLHPAIACTAIVCTCYTSPYDRLRSAASSCAQPVVTRGGTVRSYCLRSWLNRGSCFCRAAAGSGPVSSPLPD